MMRLTLIAALMLAAAPAAAEDDTFARGLAWVVATDKMCRVTYKPEALRAMIEANVAADDLAFTRDLNFYVDNITRYQLGEMTDATKAAVCVQVARVAKANGLID